MYIYIYGNISHCHRQYLLPMNRLLLLIIKSILLLLLIIITFVPAIKIKKQIPPHEHFSRYRDKHKKDLFYWPDDPWKINRVPSTFKVGFDVITDEANGTLQYVSMEELDISKYVQIEYVLGSSENMQRCIHPEFAKMTAYQKGAIEAERPESIGLLPEKPLLQEKTDEKKSSLIEIEMNPNDSICAPRGIICDICLNAVSSKISTNNVQGGCGNIEPIFGKICNKVTKKIIEQEESIKQRAMDIYSTYGPKTGASMLVCEDLSCCGSSAASNQNNKLKKIDNCMCSYSPKKLRSNNVKLDKFGAAKYVNQSRVRNMVDPIIATPDKYLKSLRKTTSSKENNNNNNKKKNLQTTTTSLKQKKIINAINDASNKIDNVWEKEWKITFELSINHGKSWIQIPIPTKYQDRQSRIVKRTVSIPDLFFKLGGKVKYRFTQYMNQCNCCSDLFVRSFSPKDVDV